MHVLSMELACSSLGKGERKHAVTLGMCCCHMRRVGSGRGSRRTLRTDSPRLLLRCPILRRQILGLRRRDVGEKPRGNGIRDRGGPALSQSRAASPNRAGRALVDSAVTLRATDLPVGLFLRPPVHPRQKKNISVFPKWQISLYSRRPVSMRGALRNVTKRGAGCGGRR